MGKDENQEKQSSSFVGGPSGGDFKPVRPRNKFRGGKDFLRETILSQMTCFGNDRELRRVRAYVWQE